MAVKNYGAIEYGERTKVWMIEQAEPHVCLKLKSMFAKIAKHSSLPFMFPHTPENCNDLLWFMERYPLSISAANLKKMKSGRNNYLSSQKKLEEITSPDYIPPAILLRPPEVARHYQELIPSFHAVQKRFLLGDDIGLGKTLSGILTFNESTLPAMVTVQTHLPAQWKVGGIEKFTYLKTHIIEGTKPYSLPPADVYIMKYSCLAGWVDTFQLGFIKSAIFDEIQELRIEDSQKYNAAKILSANVEYCMGMSATPIYNYGDEIYAVLNLINPGCLGDKWDFLREWCTRDSNHYIVNDTKALGTYLRERNLFLRRTRAQVGRELPEINKVIHTIGYDSEEVKKAENLAHLLAIKVTTGSFVERGKASRELNVFMRHITGVSKARYVAEYAKMFLENDEPIILAGWHRDVYDIWKKELEKYNPVMYTGTEGAKEKEAAKQAFLSGKSKCFIISLRSGIGLDGLQHVCKNVIYGELDWSPKVHDQVTGRVDRDGQLYRVSAYYPVSDYGTDPIMIDILGLKSSQSQGIIDPLDGVKDQYSDDTHIQTLAKRILEKKSQQTLFT